MLTVQTPEFLSHLVYDPHFLDEEVHDSLQAFLESVPLIPLDEYDPRTVFAYTRPRYDGVEVTSRKEAAAGNPIWLDGAPVVGVEMPPVLSALAQQVTEALSVLPHLGDFPAPEGFSSVYVDWYERGGYFVPHVDRETYGPIIAGVSVGTGRATLEFRRRDAPDDTAVGIPLEPGSLYAFFGQIRRDPWLHRALDVTGRRFSVTFRMAPQAT